MARSLAYTTRSRAQRDNVARSAETDRSGGGVSQGATGQGAVVGGDAGGQGRVGGVDGDSVGGRAGVLVLGHHLREVEGFAQGRGERGADIARGVADHEGHLFGGYGGGGDDEVGFVLAGGVVQNDYELAIA